MIQYWWITLNYMPVLVPYIHQMNWNTRHVVFPLILHVVSIRINIILVLEAVVEEFH